MGAVAAGSEQQAADSSYRIPYEDLREWIAQAEKLGEIRHVKGASWQEDIGMAAELVQHDENAPCVIFDEIPLQERTEGPHQLGGKRQNMTLGSPNYTKLAAQAFSTPTGAEAYSAPVVETGPVLENTITGDAIDTQIPQLRGTRATATLCRD
jgi:4-hydroxy-3-polyprenylbenzoate decarboxylase